MTLKKCDEMVGGKELCAGVIVLTLFKPKTDQRHHRSMRLCSPPGELCHAMQRPRHRLLRTPDYVDGPAKEVLEWC